METLGLVGKKIGMTRIFEENGSSIPVSIVEVLPNKVTQVKTLENDGYSAVQITAGQKKASSLSKAILGHYAKSGVEPGELLLEFKVSPSAAITVGQEFNVGIFQQNQIVDVVGISKGKGFAGVIKRHNFSTQDSTHGNSLSHRVPGSIGQRQSPGKVFKGKRMAGHLGDKRVTVHNLVIKGIDLEKNILLISGAIPGAPSSRVVVFPTKKKRISAKEESKKG